MRQNLDVPSAPEHCNAPTSGSFMRKARCAQEFQNLPHTSGGQFQKCGENRDLSTKPRFWASATCGFVGKILGVLGSFRFFPHFRNTRQKTRRPEANTRQAPFGKRPLNRENRLSAVFTDQAERTVARPHHIMTMPKRNHTDATQPQYPRSQ